ncbi:MAG: ThuA domain-containing protein [Pirellulales bacterium]|nr:ThuA domain-containing protein [Pirellulales bacterium]
MLRPALSILVVLSFVSLASANKPIKALLITGGCCHDYDKQKDIITQGVSARANVEWDIVHEGGKSTKHQVSIYKDKDWAKGYDVVVHNECFANEKDLDHIKVITEGHKNGVPAVMIHCAMHNYRGKTTDWFELTGVTSHNHGPKHPIRVEITNRDHPITKNLPGSWETPQGELYNIAKVWPNTTPLATGVAKDPKKSNICIWTNKYGDARVFGTTLGHHNETMKQEVYLDMLTAGLLWTVDKLGDDGHPVEGYGPKK